MLGPHAPEHSSTIFDDLPLLFKAHRIHIKIHKMAAEIWKPPNKIIPTKSELGSRSLCSSISEGKAIIEAIGALYDQ